jgi:hypothetical protein
MGPVVGVGVAGMGNGVALGAVLGVALGAAVGGIGLIWIELMTPEVTGAQAARSKVIIRLLNVNDLILILSP